MPIALHTPQVTRIPVSGPAPFNTLVAVTASDVVGPGETVVPGTTYRTSVTVPTPFVIAGFDPRVEVKFQHSTTAFLFRTPSAEADNFLYAVDAITAAGFSPEDGSFYVTVDTALEPPANYLPTTPVAGFEFEEITMFYISSFVLVYEPPLPGAPSAPTPSGQGTGQLYGKFVGKNFGHAVTKFKQPKG